MNIQEGTYKDVGAVILENDLLKVTVLPEWGSKTASIIHKPTGYELLWQNPEPAFRKTGYGDPYPNGDKSGFDEMFPTISRCFYEHPPWEGTEMPDHGEVWSIPWRYSLSKNCLDMRVEGIRFPYTLEKKVALKDNCLRHDYRVKNNGPAPFAFIWAAHPLFNTCPGMEFRVPEGMDSIITAVPGNPLGPYGREHPFPECLDMEGNKLDLSHVPGRNEVGYQKYYFAEKVTEGWCELHHPDQDLTIRLSYPKEQVPYLGMWLNVLGWADQYNIAPEPATAPMDRPDASALWGAGCELQTSEDRSWYLELKVS